MPASLLRPAGGPAAWPLCALALTLLACSTQGPETAEVAWSASLGAVDAPPGPDRGGVLRCEPSGEACSPLAEGSSVAAGSLLRTTRGARARIDLGGASIDLGDEASALLTSRDGPTIRVDRGSASITAAAPLDTGSPLTLVVLDQTIAIDPGAQASVAVVVPAADRASITVHRGSITLQGPGGGASSLRSGDSARLVLGEPADTRAGLRGQDAQLAQVREVAPETAEAPLPASARRGLGTVTARVPGSSAVVGGVRLLSHHVAVTVQDGIARTVVEEELMNDTARVLEGRFAFAIPPGASVSRLALWVGKDLVEGEVVERERAKRIFQGIVDDTVRPRDPALLEWTNGSEVSLRIFPIPAHESRKVVLAYDQTLPAPGGVVRYVYPLSLGSERANAIDDLSITLTARESSGAIREVMTPRYPAWVRGEGGELQVTYAAKQAVPDDDFVVTYQRDAARDVELATGSRGAPETERFAALRFTAELPDGAAAPPHIRRDRAIVVDTSGSQSEETLDGASTLAVALARSLDPDERFAVLACDSACDSYPEDGLAAPTDDAIEDASAFLAARKARGSTDLAGALVRAAGHLAKSAAGQVVYLGDGAVSAGELSAEAIAARARPSIVGGAIDLRIIGAGRTVDDVTLAAVASALGGTFEQAATGEPVASRASAIALGLRRPVVTGATIALPPGFHDAYPRVMPNVRLGQEVVVLARMAEGATPGPVTLHGTLDGAPYTLTKAIASGGVARDNPLVPRVWAEARIRDLETSGAEGADGEILTLSTRHHVLSRRTSLLVLENDRMFAEFGVKRSTRAADDAAFGDVASLADVRGAAPSGPDRSEPGAEAAAGNLWGDATGDAFGSGGLGLSGVGEGGGGKGPGDVGTLGHGAGTGQGFGSGSGRLGGSHQTRAPTVRMGSTSVSGRLPPEIIQRVVRQQFGRFRACYERGLMMNPELAGRVSVRFVIDTDGAVRSSANGGSDLPDASVVACVVAAFRALTFPAVEGGTVTVMYPILLTSDGTRPTSPSTLWPAPASPAPLAARREPRSGPTALHRALDEAWRGEGEPALAKLRGASAAAPTSRGKLDALVRGLLVRGRFDEAIVAAQTFVAQDPDLPSARELVAFALALGGDRDGAVLAIDGLVEAAPRSSAAHTRAARAFEAVGDERRACAHWRSLAELDRGRDGALREAMRCRARVLGERDAVLAEARGLAARGPLVTKLIDELETGASPAAGHGSAASPGQLEVQVTCAAGTERCPAPVVIDPGGTVASPFLPSRARSGATSVALAQVRYGTYRTLLVGGDAGASGEVEVRALGSVRRFSFTRGGAAQSIAATAVTEL